MILVDSSVWIDHLRGKDPDLEVLLDDGIVLLHPFVLGEIALGNFRNRAGTLKDLRELPEAVVAEPDEVLHLIERETLFGLGLGYIDVHLLASARLMEDTKVWTRDRRLGAAAARMSLAWALPH
jgi:predicted nucleic acid-binding protein